MKKLLIVMLICCCVSPLYAQRGRKFFPRKKSVTVSRVQAALARTREKTTPTNVSHIQITNLPDKPLVKLGGTADNFSGALPARMLEGARSFNIIRPKDHLGRYTEQIFIPQNSLENNKSFYRGMRLGELDEVKNLLVNGLEVDKSNYVGEIYASPSIFSSLGYAIDGEKPGLLVLIQIPETPALQSYLEEEIQVVTGEVIFHQDIPARFISDVWVFLETNGTPEWYKVTLEEGTLVFTPCGEMTKW